MLVLFFLKLLVTTLTVLGVACNLFWLGCGLLVGKSGLSVLKVAIGWLSQSLWRPPLGGRTRVPLAPLARGLIAPKCFGNLVLEGLSGFVLYSSIEHLRLGEAFDILSLAYAISYGMPTAN